MQPEPEIVEEAEAPAELAVLLPPARSRRELWMEVAAVFCIGVLPEIWNTVGYLVMQPVERSLYAQEAHLLFRSAQVSLLVLYLMARSQTPWSRFGIVAPRWIWDSIAAFGSLVTAYVGYSVYAAVVVETVSVEALVSPLPGILWGGLGARHRPCVRDDLLQHAPALARGGGACPSRHFVDAAIDQAARRTTSAPCGQSPWRKASTAGKNSLGRSR